MARVRIGPPRDRAEPDLPALLGVPFVEVGLLLTIPGVLLVALVTRRLPRGANLA